MNQLITKLRTRLATAIMATAILLGLGSCSSMNNNEELPSLFSVFATLESHSKTGAVFTVQSAPDATPVTLTSNANLETEGLKVGERYIIIYTNGDANDPYIEGAITLMNVLRVANGDVQIATLDEIKALQGSTEYQVEALFRTGNYINVQLKVPSTGTPGAFNIYADSATLDSAYPQLYLIYQLNTTGLSYTTAFGSFNIGEVWNKHSCNGVNIDLMSHPAAKFEKEQQQITPSTPQS